MKKLFFLLSFLLIANVSRGATTILPDSLVKGTFEEADIDQQAITNLEKEILSGKYNVHSLLILRHNKLIYEHYFPGDDAVFPVPVGVIPHTRDSLHDCRSVTKSIVSACIGIAIAQGRIRSINDSIFSYFPSYKQYATGAKAGITIRDLLTMSPGLEWAERMSYMNPANGERQMAEAADVTGFVLSRAGVAAPGTVWNYSGGCTMLLAQLIRNTTGMSVSSFANKYLFTPLGIREYTWMQREDSTVWAPSGLRLRPIDMAKIGQLYLREGRWNGKQLIPADWVKQSLKWQLNTDGTHEGYGYQFWCSRPEIAGKTREVAMADGNGGQIICMVPALGLEVVTTAGNYNQGGNIAENLLVKYIFPAVKK